MTFEQKAFSYENRETFFAQLNEEMKAYTDPVWFATLSNAASLLMQHLPNVNWAGFYLLHQKNELVLGPFQGRPACLRIQLGRGVCGTSASQRETLIVPDVDLFPGHIACDSASRSEIVVPLVKDSRLLGVLDVDAPVVQRFSEADARGLEQFAQILINGTSWPAQFNY